MTTPMTTMQAIRMSMRLNKAQLLGFWYNKRVGKWSANNKKKIDVPCNELIHCTHTQVMMN